MTAPLKTEIPDGYILLGQAGQLAREDGRCLRREKIVRSIHQGRLAAVRTGGRWMVKISDLEGPAYSVPLLAAVENS